MPVIVFDSAFDGHTLEELNVDALDRHPNELANTLAAEAIAGALCETDIVRCRRPRPGGAP